MSRDYSSADRLLIGLQQRLAGFNRPASTAAIVAPSPARTAPPDELLDSERRHAAGLMRVNHAGEVSAQALYRGQALVSRDPAVREHLLHAADEERAHLQWCEQRLAELGEKPSLLQPLWYAGSFAMGAAAGIAGDRWSLGFVEETEKQVAEHLDEHLQRLPADDARSRAVVEAMRADEQRHGQQARDLGGRPLPPPVRGLMRRIASVMKQAAYRL
ncbi:MAG: coq7 [Hydrocarboniphaga sp.]|uniref:2-polyprenyl-3-methyl-6-methoxy-1,4-benzoquinone monooxygenase n=1 Tax=Hydrocarboniphaga sp. TaxID=2033016 RepID=UPI00261627FF|nr:2-polyprenyl-3-methyl-6-methoxy-1,4-benzoquinone monooxygenase [Hydrocarboniphaga sp.]MDB5970327.1 coq7 [Hydrocarboniphaga sp.]